jgi:hypothetical protein
VHVVVWSGRLNTGRDLVKYLGRLRRIIHGSHERACMIRRWITVIKEDRDADMAEEAMTE